MQRSSGSFNLVFLLSVFHIVTITASNYLVQIPFQMGGLLTTWGAFTYPFILLATNLTVSIYGSKQARKIIFLVMFPALLTSYLVSVLFVNGTFQSIESLTNFNLYVARIAIASFTAYLIGQIIDITIFNRLRLSSAWWAAPACSTVVWSLVDTMSFFSLAFAGSSDTFMAIHWMEIAVVDYGCKLLISLLFFLPMYGMLLNLLAHKLKTHMHITPNHAMVKN
ncbi:MAG: 7-cyano-7-deazaguanine/7-aminomethyl-7-deazaguanine transporter [Candidatus Endonucleobacter bathymodioli]|uniref:Probable queuosine precursor transporter n=1 Tax=Candidatus Endonucleibacter bathymodioli TaxID=539814 RepID=A0AA90NLX8_9GAMM|nr:7-cyano-7-deazaguanine/7-aminomethyl-7-deazaguanine transporter [Candidatus Endonucleobacter bathymodioli]